MSPYKYVNKENSVVLCAPGVENSGKRTNASRSLLHYCDFRTDDVITFGGMREGKQSLQAAYNTEVNSPK